MDHHFVQKKNHRYSWLDNFREISKDKPRYWWENDAKLDPPGI
jgi:hypothetical protein